MNTFTIIDTKKKGKQLTQLASGLATFRGQPFVFQKPSKADPLEGFFMLLRAGHPSF